MTSKGVHSVPKSLQKSYELLKRQDGISRIIVGSSESAKYKSATGTFKYVSDFAGGIKIKGFSDRGITYFFVHCSNPEEIKIFLEETFDLK